MIRGRFLVTATQCPAFLSLIPRVCLCPELAALEMSEFFCLELIFYLLLNLSTASVPPSWNCWNSPANARERFRLSNQIHYYNKIILWVNFVNWTYLPLLHSVFLGRVASLKPRRQKQRFTLTLRTTDGLEQFMNAQYVECRRSQRDQRDLRTYEICPGVMWDRHPTHWPDSD